MRFHYDKKVDALYIRFLERRYAESDEVAEGIIFDYDRGGKIIGLEVLNASKRFPSEFRQKLQRGRVPLVLELRRGIPAGK